MGADGVLATTSSAADAGAARIGVPRAACGGSGGILRAAETALATFGWAAGAAYNPSNGSALPRATGTVGAVASSCGFELTVVAGGAGVETLALYAGVGGSGVGQPINVSASTAAAGSSSSAAAAAQPRQPSSSYAQQLRGVQTVVHARQPGAADAVMHLWWDAPKGTAVTVRWEVAAAAAPPAPTPPPAAAIYTVHAGKSCGTALGAPAAAPSQAACEALCSADAACSCAQYDAARGQCAARAVCQLTACAPLAGIDTLAKAYTEVGGRNCYSGHGATELDHNVPLANVSVQECLDYCESDPACSAAQYKVSGGGAGGGADARSCWRRSNVVLSKCKQQDTQDVYLRPSTAPSATPNPDGALLYAAALLAGPPPPLNGFGS